MAAQWKSSLRILQNEIRAVSGKDDVFHHGLVFVDGDPPAELVQRIPRFYAACGELIDRIVVPIPSGGFHLHYFFSEYSSGPAQGVLRALRQKLSDLHNIVAKIPKRVLPSIAVPPREDGLEENALRWMYILHWLGGLPDHSVFKTEVEFLRSREDAAAGERFLAWNHCSTVPGFDPVSFLTLTMSSKEDLNHWKRLHVKAGKQFPKLIAISLTKPIHYASVNTVDLLLGRAGDEETTVKTKRVRHSRPQEGQKRDLNSDHEAVLSVLKQHHGYGTDAPNFKPLKIETIRVAIADKWPSPGPKGWVYSRVQRAMNELFGGMKVYRAKCSNETILDYIQDIEDPLMRERLLDKLDWIKDTVGEQVLYDMVNRPEED